MDALQVVSFAADELMIGELKRRAAERGWKLSEFMRAVTAEGLAHMDAGPSTSSLLVQGGFRLASQHLEQAHQALAQIEARLGPAPAPAVTTCGAALAPTPAAADAALSAGATVLASPNGVMLLGVTPGGERATVALDLGSGHLELAADGKRVTTEVGLPEAFAITELLEGALAQARAKFDRASGSHSRHVGGEARLDGLTLICCSGGPDGPSLSMGGLTVRCGTLDLMRLTCELRASVTRSTCTALQARKGLDSVWAASPGAVVEAI